MTTNQLFASGYSLINVCFTHEDGTVSGYWMQDKTGDLADAIAWAKRTEQVNSNKITVAVVARVPGPCAGLEFHERLKRLG